MSATQSDGATLREHLTSQWRQTGKMPKMLEDALQVPVLAAHVWSWFLELNDERQIGVVDSKLTHEQITEWAKAYGVRIEPWERRAIKRIDNLFARMKQEAQEGE